MRRLRCPKCGVRKAQVWKGLTNIFIWCPECKHQVDSPSLAQAFSIKDGKVLKEAQTALIKAWNEPA